MIQTAFFGVVVIPPLTTIKKVNGLKTFNFLMPNWLRFAESDPGTRSIIINPPPLLLFRISMVYWPISRKGENSSSQMFGTS